jgi:CubicO group peptidase (beta-lactamase class C family)
MPGRPRSLPARPSLRHLKLEAKRRVAAGEFPSLHEAQAAIAWEHGLPSWATLKQRVRQVGIQAEAGAEAGAGAGAGAEAAAAGQAEQQQSHAVAQLRWVRSRFAQAGQPGWTAPSDDELRGHFDDRFLAALPPATLVATISQVAADLRDGELEVLGQAPFQAHVQLNGVQYIALAEDQPPHRLTTLRGVPVGSRVRDPRMASPPVRTMGEVPDAVPEIAGQAFAELGLVALLVAGGKSRDHSPWLVAQGWADLDRGEALDPGHRFPAPGVTALVTVTAVLRLVAEGRIGLDRPANDQLRAVRLADDTITVRELLTHTAGVDSPGPTEMYADRPTELAELMGPVIACTGPRGTMQPSNGGCAVLGQLIADVTGLPYAEAAARLVLEPLKLNDSSFPARPPSNSPGIGPGAVTSYNLTLGGTFVPIPARMPTMQAVAGLWSTGADLVRLGLGWSSLLPGALAHEALTPQPTQTMPAPQAPQIPQSQPGDPQDPGPGLGWLLNPRTQAAVHAGAGFEGTACLTVRTTDHRVHVVLTSRMIPINSIEARLQAAGE